MSIKDAVEQVLPECYAEASSDGRYPTSPRQLYYRVRPKVLALTGKELGYGYFGADLLPHYLQDHAETKGWRLYFKARGNLSEPHTGTLIPLGTAEVAQYVRSWDDAGAPARHRGADLGCADPRRPEPLRRPGRGREGRHRRPADHRRHRRSLRRRDRRQRRPVASRPSFASPTRLASRCSCCTTSIAPA